MGAGESYDLAIVGGGVNGCGIARDAQGRALRVIVVEMADLASGTSSSSTKLIHGGLRYLEHHAFRLVREALTEREVLLRMAPHIIWPLRFVLPHHKGLRPWPLIRLGLYLYDHLGGRRALPGTRGLDLANDEAGQRLKEQYRRGFEYSDCWVDDARLVVLNARDAADHGCHILTRTLFLGARREGAVWRLALEDRRTGERREIAARALVNAAGPWVTGVNGTIEGHAAAAPVRLVKGSHIVVDRVFTHDRAYIFQNADRRICFAIPYETDFTLIGTTDLDYVGDPAAVAIDDGETTYLLDAVNAYLARPIARSAIRWSYAGVRPLYDDGAPTAQQATRDYVLRLDGDASHAPLLSVIGGKITTYRRLAEHALTELAPAFPNLGPAWTAGSTLPGGDISHGDFDGWSTEIARQHGSLDRALVLRLCRSYGTRVAQILSGVARPADMGRDFGAGLTEREVRFLVDNEWAETAEDILWRRTKIGLHIDDAGRAALEHHLAALGDGPARVGMVG
jgi:glycerol-3-phosphate dehydrogenase